MNDQDTTTHDGHGLDTSEQGGGQMPISVRFDAENRKTGWRCCRTYTDGPRNSASLLETLQQKLWSRNREREQEQREKLRNRFGSTSSSPREIPFFFFVLSLL